MDLDLPELPSDPAKRIRNLDYDPNTRDRVRRYYLLEGPCQPREHYIHCFAHQLQLALVALVDLIKKNILRKAQDNKIIDDLANEDIISGQGLNQERVIERRGDTCWGSHYRTLASLLSLFGSVVEVLDAIAQDGSKYNQKYVSSILLTCIQSYDFVFTLHMMENILGITNDLSQALQRKYQDIENALRLVDIVKRRLQKFRDDAWSSLIEKVLIFYGKHDIGILKMDDAYIMKGKSLRRAEKKTNFHHYHVDLFISVINMQLQELNYRFNESIMKLLLCIACLNPQDSFSSFNVGKLIRFAELYPRDFSNNDLLSLSNQLENFIMDMCSNVDLANIKAISDVTRMMVESKRDIAYPLVYKLLCLALILLATVERAFSGMKIVKNRLRNRMSNEWLSNSLLVYIEKDISSSLAIEVIMNRFQIMGKRRGRL